MRIHETGLWCKNWITYGSDVGCGAIDGLRYWGNTFSLWFDTSAQAASIGDLNDGSTSANTTTPPKTVWADDVPAVGDTSAAVDDMVAEAPGVDVPQNNAPESSSPSSSSSPFVNEPAAPTSASSSVASNHFLSAFVAMGLSGIAAFIFV